MISFNQVLIDVLKGEGVDVGRFRETYSDDLETDLATEPVQLGDFYIQFGRYLVRQEGDDKVTESISFAKDFEGLREVTFYVGDEIKIEEIDVVLRGPQVSQYRSVEEKFARPIQDSRDSVIENLVSVIQNPQDYSLGSPDEGFLEDFIVAKRSAPESKIIKPEELRADDTTHDVRMSLEAVRYFGQNMDSPRLKKAMDNGYLSFKGEEPVLSAISEDGLPPILTHKGLLCSPAYNLNNYRNLVSHGVFGNPAEDAATYLAAPHASIDVGRGNMGVYLTLFVDTQTLLERRGVFMDPENTHNSSDTQLYDPSCVSYGFIVMGGIPHEAIQSIKIDGKGHDFFEMSKAQMDAMLYVHSSK